MKAIVRTVTLALALAPALALGQAGTWSIDPAHTHAGFAVRHMVISNVRGELGKVEGTLTLDEKDVTRSKVEATIDVAGVNTREPKRDDDLRSENFFDVAKYPTMTFKSTKVEKAGKDGLKVTGDLTMHGVTKPVVLKVKTTPEVKDPWGMVRRGFSATTRVDRRDFGITWNKVLEGGGAIVGNDAEIEIEAEFVKK
ncbi:MAG TPA: YceI family protein [Anaeromyxobacteraceae bacterium]|nr:YceI family protein [Anaeromyxobacteraceae bacterium]